MILSIFINLHVLSPFRCEKGWIDDSKHQLFMGTLEMKTIHVEVTYGTLKIVKLSRMGHSFHPFDLSADKRFESVYKQMLTIA